MIGCTDRKGKVHYINPDGVEYLFEHPDSTDEKPLTTIDFTKGRLVVTTPLDNMQRKVEAGRKAR